MNDSDAIMAVDPLNGQRTVSSDFMRLAADMRNHRITNIMTAGRIYFVNPCHRLDKLSSNDCEFGRVSVTLPVTAAPQAALLAASFSVCASLSRTPMALRISSICPSISLRSSRAFSKAVFSVVRSAAAMFIKFSVGMMQVPFINGDWEFSNPFLNSQSNIKIHNNSAARNRAFISSCEAVAGSGASRQTLSVNPGKTDKFLASATAWHWVSGSESKQIMRR